jgi:transcriptional regulator with XRE-family HTH domain
VDQPATFGEQLRRLRQQRGLSIRDLAKLAHHSKSVVWEWESGLKVPTADVTGRLDQLLDGDGVLTAAAGQLAPVNGHAERLAHVAAAPRTVDAASVDALAGILANMRRLEDSIGPGPLVAATAGPLKLIETLADEARGPLRPAWWTWRANGRSSPAGCAPRPDSPARRATGTPGRSNTRPRQGTGT